jgi:hypothetical protein
MAKYKAEGPLKTVSTPEEFALPGQMTGVDRRTPEAVRADVTAKIIAQGGDPSSRTQSLPTSVGESYEAGTLKQTHPSYITISHAALPKRGVSESHENYTKKLAAHPAGALWMRSLALPGTVMSSHGIHFDTSEFDKHWGVPHQNFIEASNKGATLPVPTDDDYNLTYQSVMSSGINQAKAEWQEMYGDSGNSYTDADGTATGDAE